MEALPNQLTTTIPVVYLCFSVAPCFLPTTCCAFAISTFPKHLCLPTQPTLFPSPVCVTGQLWSPLANTVFLLGTSPSWPTSLAHSLTFLRVLPIWTLSSTRNGSWRDFRCSGSPKDQARFRLLRLQLVSKHNSFLHDPLLERVACVCDVPLPPCSRLACSLIRHAFRSPTVTPDLCHMHWHGASRSALPPHEARSQQRSHFSSPTRCSLFSDEFFHSLSLFFASLTSLHESGRFDAAFSYDELVAALPKCHESAPGADCLPYLLFKVFFPWWRHLLIFFQPRVASLLFPQLGSQAWLFRSSSATVTPLLLTPIPFLSPPAPKSF